MKGGTFFMLSLLSEDYGELESKRGVMHKFKVVDRFNLMEAIRACKQFCVYKLTHELRDGLRDNYRLNGVACLHNIENEVDILISMKGKCYICRKQNGHIEYRSIVYRKKDISSFNSIESSLESKRIMIDIPNDIKRTNNIPLSIPQVVWMDPQYLIMFEE